jgi:predicted ATPase with chaperone activity
MHSPNFHPKPARTIEETGLPFEIVFDLVLKHAFLQGKTTLQRLSKETKLDFGVLQEVYRSLHSQHLSDTKGMIGVDYEFALSAAGVHAAEAAYRKSQYVGPAPVPFASYASAVREQVLRPKVTRLSLRECFSDLVLAEEVISELGAAIMTGGVIFLYGSTGNGKTSIAERIHRIFHDPVFIPYAVEISGQILNLYDPAVHQAWERQPSETDRRWNLCRRPFLRVGGELHIEMLQPRIDETTRIGVAPLQMQANDGILVIDDFGRQRITPVELLNRWIMPLDQHIDYLSLWSGARFEVPFELMLVFATNLDPAELAEEAFMRRIKNKIKIQAVTPDIFAEIMYRHCEERGIEYTADVVEYAAQQCSERSPGGLRACFPRDLLDIIAGVAAFEQRAPKLNRPSLDQALKLYFTR